MADVIACSADCFIQLLTPLEELIFCLVKGGHLYNLPAPSCNVQLQHKMKKYIFFIFAAVTFFNYCNSQTHACMLG